MIPHDVTAPVRPHLTTSCYGCGCPHTPVATPTRCLPTPPHLRSPRTVQLPHFTPTRCVDPTFRLPHVAASPDRAGYLYGSTHHTFPVLLCHFICSNSYGVQLNMPFDCSCSGNASTIQQAGGQAAGRAGGQGESGGAISGAAACKALRIAARGNTPRTATLCAQHSPRICYALGMARRARVNDAPQRLRLRSRALRSRMPPAAMRLHFAFRRAALRAAHALARARMRAT